MLHNKSLMKEPKPRLPPKRRWGFSLNVGFGRRPRFRIALGRKNVNLISPGGVRAMTGAI